MTRRKRFLAPGLALSLLFAGTNLSAASAKAPAANDPLDAALEKRASGKGSLDDVEIEASWQLTEANRSVHIWGSGVGIWENSVQFRLSREQVLEVIQMLLEAKVGAIPDPGSKKAPAPKAPLQLRGELTVVVGDEKFHRQQLSRGDQSEALRQVTTRILEFSEKAAKGGIRATSLQDGLAKVGDGTLVPQAFSAFVRRQTTASQPEGDSYLLRIKGRHVSDRMMPRGEVPPPPKELTISDEDVRKLARAIGETDPASFARTTYAPTYTDVTVEVLDYERNTPARPYLDVTAETHGEKQKAFDRMYALLRELHERVQKEGTPAKTAPVARPAGAPRPASPAKP